MPIYEYRCADCGKTFDALQKFSDEPFTNCGQATVACDTKGKGQVSRLMSSPSFHLKGTGWYATDYKKGGTTKPAASSSGSDAKSETKSESKTEGSSGSTSSSSTESAPASTPAKKDS